MNGARTGFSLQDTIVGEKEDDGTKATAIAGANT